MDGDTTSINELPIITSLPPNDANEEMEKINLTTERNMIDRETINIAQEKNEKRVHFEDEMQKNEIKKPFNQNKNMI